MFGFNNKKEKKEVKDTNSYLVIDIGTENVKTVLFRRKDEKNVEVIGYSRVPQESTAMSKAIIMDFYSVMNAVDHSIGEAISHAESKFNDIELPSSAFIGIAGELVTGVPVIVNVERDNPKDKITKKELNGTIEKVKEHTFASSKDEIADEVGLNANQIVELETRISSIYVDDMKASSPEGLTGEILTYKVFSSFAPKIQVESVQKIADELKLDLKKIVVEPYAMANALEDIINDPVGAIIIDIGAGTSDIAVIKNGDIVGVKMFAIGGRVFTKRIAKEMVTGYDEAEELKIEYSSGKLDEYRKKQIKTALKNDVKSWLLGVELALEELDDVDEFPPNIYICGGGSQLPDIMEGLMSHPWIQSLNFKKHPKVNLLLPNKVAGVTDLTRTAKEPIDVTPLAMTREVFE